ncbi:GTP-binding protein Era [Gloeocapsa sp. PCC 73106]|nr:GTPase Era [Gloeocapsa sp. PCC 73106]ELR98537.1 GTP-binding protein Era [Gloeocapsa sp. PCC 73106]
MNDLTLGMIPLAPPDFKSGFVAIVGRPNVGKSTLLNQLVGQKIAITSPVAQTTRHRLQGILTTDEAQIIFIDTPGIHKPHHELGKILVNNAKKAMQLVDLILLVVDSSVPAGKGDRYVVELLADNSTPVILGLNKSDLQSNPELDESYLEIAREREWETIKFSALNQLGIDKLQSILIDKLEPGPYYYPPELVTDMPERMIMAELIREQILHLTRQEIPHSVAIVIEKIETTPKITRVFAAINVERKSQKGIIIGKEGSMLKAIGTAAREQIAKLIEGEVYLKLFVKVEPMWRQSQLHLGEFGYKLDK